MIFTENLVNDNQSFNLSIGAFNERLGLNIANFSYTFYTKDNNEVFVSVGNIVLFLWTAGLGWKRYFKIKNKDKISPFVCSSILKRWGNKLAVTNGSSIREDNCINFATGVSFHIAEIKTVDMNLYFQMGAFLSHDFRNETAQFGFINLEFRFKKNHY